jgi:hypothetical protein
MNRAITTLCLMLAACGPDIATTGPGGTGGSSSGTGGAGSTGGGSSGTGGGSASTGGGSASTGGGTSQGTGGGSSQSVEYPVYAHSDHTLYSITLSTKALVVIGSFGTTDVITDLAVAPDGTIYVVSHTTLYTADPHDGHVTKIGTLSDCGQDNVALSFLPDARLFVADYKGQFCQIDYSVSPPTVTPVAKLSANMAVSGDLVAVKDGTLYASAYDLSNSSTQTDNVLVKINPDTASVTMVGASGYPKLFGVAFSLGKVFGFTHDGTGRVVTIDPATGQGTLFNTFMDPSTGQPISFAGAGVNALVSPTIN